jgi:fumarylpyruvate hydrolase
VGRNYAEHRKEMGGSDRDEPFFFQKPHDAVFQSPIVFYPKGTYKLSYEAELVAIVGGRSAPNIYGYALGVDLTKRDIQTEAKNKGRPWESSKAFDKSGLVGEIMPLGSLSDTCTLQFIQNGQVKQSAKISDMIWSVPELISKLESQDFSVREGDFIFTGTPAGVGELSIGDHCEVCLVDSEGHNVLPKLSFTVAR